jgi:hypothetical protein
MQRQSKVNLQRDNHFLPKCYQEGFTDEDGHVWAKRTGEEPEPRNPSRLGRSRSLYIRNINGVEDDRIESFLGREVEDRFAMLSRRVKRERNEISAISPREQADLLLFMASQAVRTLAHRQCVDTQAGKPVDKNIFLQVMFRQMWTMADVWGKNPPTIRFFTNLPYVRDQFITGDNPVVVIHVADNKVWVPTDSPQHKITHLRELLNSPNVGFWLSLSPYVCVSVQPRDGSSSYLPPETLEPPQVRMFNKLVRDQSHIFTLARDRASLN